MLKSRQGALGPRHVALAVLVLAFSLLSCGREITGPNAGLRFAKGLSFLSELPPPLASVAEGAGSVVAFDRVRVVFLRTLDEGIAFDRVFPFSGDTDSISISIDVELSPSAPSAGEPLDLFLRYLNATGDTVFSGGPVRVMATPSGPGAPPAQPVSVPLTYTGPGADATGVTIAPDTLTVIAGESFTFSATAVNAQLDTRPGEWYAGRNRLDSRSRRNN